MSTFILKLIACITMLADHIGWFSYMGYRDLGNVLRAFGRISFPIFAYLIAFGFTKTRNKYLYLLRLIIVGVISELPYNYCFHNLPSRFNIISGQNILLELGKSLIKINNVYFTLALGLLSIILYDLIWQGNKLVKLLAPLPSVILALAAHLLGTDYGAYGVLLIFVFYLVKDNKIGITVICTAFACRKILECLLKAWISSNSVVYEIGAWNMMQLFAIFAVVPILICNGSRGPQPKSKFGQKSLKYFFYLFYPVHLLILGVVFRW